MPNGLPVNRHIKINMEISGRNRWMLILIIVTLCFGGSI